jgi:hypothetical protein
MIGINQLRWLSSQPRVAQPHRYESFMASLRFLLLGASLCSAVQVCSARPPMDGHPILGTWDIPFSETCHEIWTFRLDGTTHNASGGEESTSEYEITDLPNTAGYYVLSDTIIETNGKPDCRGARVPAGDHAVVFLLPTPKGGFMLCYEETPASCLYEMFRLARLDS